MQSTGYTKTGIELIEAAASFAAASLNDISAYAALHAVLGAETPDHRADCEAMAREWFDAAYGRNALRVLYGVCAAGALSRCAEVYARQLIGTEVW